ncbi:MAG: EAL domain-containing protein [Burkholderiaceae bacterium]
MSSFRPSFVVGIGGGAGALYALAKLFKAMPADTGCAFVLLRTIREPATSMCAAMLQRASDMPVVVVRHAQQLQANTIYLMADDFWVDVSLHELNPVRVSRPGDFGPVDGLFAGLGSSWAERSIGIVLSGNGNDGANGATSLVDAGGLMLTQSQDSAELPQMPGATLARGCVQDSLPPADLAGVLCAFVQGCGNATGAEYFPARYAGLRQLQALHRRINALSVSAAQTGSDNKRVRKPLSITDAVTGQLQTAEDEALRIAATTFEAQDAMLVLDGDGAILRANKSFSRLFSVDADALAGEQPEFVFADIHDEQWRAQMREALRRDGVWTGELLCRRSDDSVFPCWHRMTAVRNSLDQTTHFVGMFNDITERKQAEEKIRRLAFTDPLTDLPNRRLILERLTQRLEITGKEKSFGAILLLDLDRFKTLNDTLGHEVGDQLLMQVSRRLQHSVRGSDTVGRLGGDEFLIVLNELSRTAHDAAGAAEAIAGSVRDVLARPFTLNGMTIESGASIGICLFSGEPTSIDTLLRHADLALMQARQAGRHMVRFYNPVMQAKVDARTVLDLSLRRAIAQGDLMMMYQPQIDRQGKLMGAEGLIRWRDRERGLVLPGEFIGHAEETGLILPIGRWVLETACQQLLAWSRHERTRDLKLSVNISPRQFRQTDFAGAVRELLEETGVNPSLLRFELTENVLLEDPEDAIVRMGEIRKLGVGISIDDFGTGYSSLSYLKRLPVDQLKIDKSFVDDLIGNEDDAAIIRAIIGMGRSMNLQVFAEGVETQAQYEFLEKSGCDAFQGYLFGKPVAGTGELLAATAG